MIRAITGFAIFRPVLVIAVWVAVVAAGFGVGVGVFERLQTSVGVVPDSESDRASERIAAAAPQPEAITAVVAGQAATDPALRSDVDRAVADVRGIPGVVAVDGPLPSTVTGQALALRVTLAPGGTVETAAATVAARLHAIQAPEVTVAGGPLTDDEFGMQAESDVQRAELLTMPIVLLLLLLIFRGLLPASMPLLIAGVGIGVTFGVLFLFSTVSDVSVYSIQVATMLSVGLAVDYALLLVNRFREERAVDPDVRGALVRTCASAGRTVFFSGLTVTVALAGLTVFPDLFLRSMGLAGAAVVAVDMLAALTLLPALLALVGRRIAPARPAAEGGGAFARIARAVQRRPGLTAILATGMIAVLALPSLQLALGQSDARSLPTSTQTRAQYDALAAHFPELVERDPVTVAAATSAADPALAALRDRIAALPEITRVEEHPIGDTLTVLRAVPQRSPADADARRAVAAIREMRAPFDVAVTGQAARLVDYRAMLADRAPRAALLVVGATLVLLFAFTGSVLLPVKAVLTSALSIGAALGVVVWVFQEGNLSAQRLDTTDLTVPVLVAAIAFGLSVDYELFLLSRIRERWLAGAGDRAAVAEGLQRTGRIVTSAALLLAVVFVGFLVGGFTPIRAIGLGLMLAVILDATVVRMLLVPATMTLVSRFNWWAPRPLRRLHDRLGLTEEPVATPRAPAPEPDPVTV